MPCRCEGYDEAPEDKLREELDAVTQKLCYVCGTIEQENLWATFTSDQRIKKWWKKHHANDTKRVTDAMIAYVTKHPRTMATNIANAFIRKAEVVHPCSDFHKAWFYDIAKKAVDEHRANKQTDKAIQDSIKDKLSPAELEYVRHHKVVRL